MNTATILIKTNPTTKTQAQETARELGFSLSSILNGFLKQFIRTKTINFTASDEIPNAYLRKEIKKAMEDLKAGKASPKFYSAKDSIKWLEQQGI